MLSRILGKGLSVSILTLATVVSSVEAAWAGKHDFWVVNTTHSHVTGLYITESFLDTWGNDITGPGVLGNGLSMKILFNNLRTDVCHYDIRAEFSNGNVVEDYAVNVCFSGGYTFFDI